MQFDPHAHRLIVIAIAMTLGFQRKRRFSKILRSVAMVLGSLTLCIAVFLALVVYPNFKTIIMPSATTLAFVILGICWLIAWRYKPIPENADVQMCLAEIEELGAHDVQRAMLVELATAMSEEGSLEKTRRLAKETASSPVLSQLRFIRELHALFSS